MISRPTAGSLTDGHPTAWHPAAGPASPGRRPSREQFSPVQIPLHVRIAFFPQLVVLWKRRVWSFAVTAPLLPKPVTGGRK
jgi:hypothetical protein